MSLNNEGKGLKRVNIKKDIRFRVYVAFTCICLLGVLSL